MLDLTNRIKAFSHIGKYILAKDEQLTQAVKLSVLKNRWFTEDNVWLSLEAITKAFLDASKLHQFASNYTISDQQKAIGLVLAGNIPCVGFHDILCVILSGNLAKIKLSDKDAILIPLLLKQGELAYPGFEQSFQIVERLKDFDAVIATGSNNASLYFDQYFGKYPHIFRKNRNAVAVLSGEESETELDNLAIDIFQYFGLGCRNVSKLYLPEGYDISKLMEHLDRNKNLANHNKYRNNYDYTLALWLLNKVEFLQNSCLLLKEDPMIPSRIATVHYEYYTDIKELNRHLIEKDQEIQCIVSSHAELGVDYFAFGEAQKPAINDYADGVDTMQFLTNL